MTNLTTKQKKAKERMTYKEILQKAFVKAITNEMGTRGFSMEQMIERWAEFVWTHDFAKAFWGETPAHQVNGKQAYWQYHLQQMVLEDDPIKYLEKYL